MRPRSYSRSDHGFTLVELIIVMSIIAIMMAISYPMYKSTRETVRKKAIVAAAGSYAGVVSTYRADNANFTPTLGVATEWPAGSIQGPLNKQFVPPKPYLRGGPPEIMVVGLSIPSQGGRLLAAPSATGGTLVYTRVGTTMFRIVAYWKGVALCQIGNATPLVAAPPIKIC